MGFLKKLLNAFALNGMFIFMGCICACGDFTTRVDNAFEEFESESSSSSLDESSSAGELIGESSNSFSITGQDENGKLYVILRDFQPNHSDFENFSGEAVKKSGMIPMNSSLTNFDLIYGYVTKNGVAMKDFGYGDEWYTDIEYHKSCANEVTLSQGAVGIQVGVDGLPMQVNPNLPDYLQQLSVGPVLLSGRYFKERDKDNYRLTTFLNGYANTTEKLGAYEATNKTFEWTSEVVYTPGMVMPHLIFNKTGNGSIDMVDGVVIQKQNERCDNKNFIQWFADVPGVNKRTDEILEVSKFENSGDFIFDHNANNGGFFPLDSIDPDSRMRIGRAACGTEICDQFGAQSLSVFCPPYYYEYASTQTSLYGENTFSACDYWLNLGGPRNPEAAAAAAELDDLGLTYLRNYNFTMMGYTTFKYNAANQVPEHEFFEFAGDNDLWVFVDGVLVVDLGGVHQYAPSKVDINTLAVNNHGCHAGEPLSFNANCNGASDEKGWADGSLHHLHIFYTNRQTIGSSFFFRAHLK